MYSFLAQAENPIQIQTVSFSTVYYFNFLSFLKLWNALLYKTKNLF